MRQFDQNLRCQSRPTFLTTGTDTSTDSTSYVPEDITDLTLFTSLLESLTNTDATSGPTAFLETSQSDTNLHLSASSHSTSTIQFVIT
jgi:hypothetical protein